MAGPAPTYQPTFSDAQVATCRALIRRQSASQAQGYRAKLALLLHATPALDNEVAGRQLGKHANWVRYWRKTWVREGFRLTDKAGRGRKPAFPPPAVATVQALACELPAYREEPLRRYGTADLVRLISAHPARPPMRASTIWRILTADALKPWQHQRWRFPRDPQFLAKAGRVLDLDAGWWAGQPLHPADCVRSADEQTRIQARHRRATTPPLPGQPMRVEHAYARGGALAYRAAWDVRRGGVIGRCEATTGIAPFDRLVAQVMAENPYRSAPRVCWIVDNGSSHRGAAACQRLQDRYPNLILVHLPIHASWLNQVESSFAIGQRTVLTPDDCPDLAAVERRLLAFAALYNDTAVPFHWRCTRQHLEDRLAALPELPPPRSEPPPTDAHCRTPIAA